MLVAATEEEALAQMKVQCKTKRPKTQADLEMEGKRVRSKVCKDKECSAESKVRLAR